MFACSPEDFAAGCQAKLDENVRVTNVDVVAGYGLVAKKTLKKGCFLVDATVSFFKGPPPDFRDFNNPDGDCFRSILIGGTLGHFQIKPYSGEQQGITGTSPTFYMNAAAKNVMPNVRWASYHYDKTKPPVVKWDFLMDIEPDQELFGQYQFSEVPE
jgi:hypothetical protein